MFICLTPKTKLAIIRFKRKIILFLTKYLPQFILCKLGYHKWIIVANQFSHKEKCKYCKITRNSEIDDYLTTV
jgi:hypothetical protein